MADVKFNIKAHSESPTRTVVKARNFQLIIDEPENLGGEDRGANPVEYMQAALSGCLNVMCHIIAKEMNFELKGVEIEISGPLNPQKLFGEATTDRAGFKQIDVNIKPYCDVEPKRLEEWLRKVESRCPVSDNLAHPTPINITLKK